MNPWVPLDDAAEALSRSVKTIRTWARHGELRTIADPKTGRTLIHWLDARRLDAAKARRHRRLLDIKAQSLNPLRQATHPRNRVEASPITLEKP